MLKISFIRNSTETGIKNPYCEKCGKTDDALIQNYNIFSMLRTCLCNKCYREWEMLIVGNVEYNALQATTRLYNRASTIEESDRLYFLQLDVIKGLSSTLEGWLES